VDVSQEGAGEETYSTTDIPEDNESDFNETFGIDIKKIF
jgi:hypothetical protein